jgi:glycosyltransferase involved in cell wall biosynthesis
MGMPVVSLSETEVSFRLHPWHTARGIGHMAQAASRLRWLARRFKPDVVHANSIRAGLIVALASAPAPHVLHVRDCMPRGKTADLVRGLLTSRVAMVLANSRYTAANFAAGEDLPAVRVVYNAVDLERFDPDRIDPAAARASLGMGANGHSLGVVSQITPWKAQDDAIRVVARLRERGLDVSLLVVGDAKFTGTTRYDNDAFETSLHKLVSALGLDGRVRFLGERRDIPRILRALDLVLVPSWEEPFGRVVIEAMAMKTPVLSTEIGGPAEIVTSGEDGVLLPPKDPEQWAEESARLLRDERRRRVMGRNGRETVVARFRREAHVQAVMAGYEQIANGDKKP